MSDDRNATDGFDELGDREYIVTEIVKTSRPNRLLKLAI